MRVKRLFTQKENEKEWKTTNKKYTKFLFCFDFLSYFIAKNKEKKKKTTDNKNKFFKDVVLKLEHKENSQTNKATTTTPSLKTRRH